MRRHHRRLRLVAALTACALLTAACGSRLSGVGLKLAEGRGAGGRSATGAALGLTGGTGVSGATGTGGTGTGGTTGPGSTGSGSGGRHGGRGHGGHSGSGRTGGGSNAGGTGSGGNGSGNGGGNGGSRGGLGAPMPKGGNGGATAPGVTGNQITIANIASISGVAPGLTQSAQQATEAFAAYVNSEGGIYGRDLKVLPFDDGNDSGQNYTDAEQACKSAFAIVGSASGFDDGSASAVAQCHIPYLGAELSTTAAGENPYMFGASPGNAHYWPLGPAEYLKSRYPDAIKHAAMIYLNVPATQEQASHEMAAYKSVGFHYVYTASVSPTEPNYAPYVVAMQQAGVQYVTEYSDDSSAERLLQAMQQQNWHPQVVDWFSEEYTPSFVQQAGSFANGDLLLMSTSAYNEEASNPGMQLFQSWMDRVAPGATHDIFGIFAWSACLAFLDALKAAGPHLTRAGLLNAIGSIHTWTGDGLQPPVNLGDKVPSNCFSYFQIAGGGFQRVAPSRENTWDCSGGLYRY